MFGLSAQNPTTLMMADIFAGRPAIPRSPKWPAFRDKWIELHPFCAVCGFEDYLNVHHIVPFHLNSELELSITNLITLGEKCPTGNHHLLFGHLGLWASWNVLVVDQATTMLNQIKNRPMKVGDCDAFNAI